MPIFNNILAGASGQATGYDIDQSLRFNDDDSASLLWTPSGNGNRRTWTVSFWTKRGHISDISYIFTANSYNNFCGFGSADQIQILAGNGSTFDIQSTQVFRDPSAWYHMVYVIDTTESTDSNRVKCWANGSEVTLAVSGGGWPSLNQELDFNTTVAFGVGGNTTYNYDGYLAEFHFIDGTALTPASFGETNSSTNQWVPIEYTGSYGTNGFYQKYSATELANSFTDSSEAGGRHNISASGDAHTDTSVKKIGTASVQFDGTGDYLTAPSNDDWDFGTGDFTLEMWIRFANKNTGSGAAGANALIANHNSPNGWQWIWRGSDNTFELWSTDGDEYSSSFTLNNDTWYHVAVTRDGNTLRHYVDGVQCGSNAFTETMSDTSTTLQIGSYDASGLGIIDGYMDEIRISDTCRYPDGTTFTPSTTAFTADSNTRLLLHCDGSDGGTSFPDSATRVITANGDVANSRAQAKIGESSIKFDGTADYLSVADSADWALGSNFTVETWVRFASTSSDLTLLNHWKGNGVLASWSLQLDGGNTAKFYYSTDGVNSAGNSSWSWTPSLNTWYHVAVVRDGSDLEFYVDGTQTGSTYDISSSTIANIAWPLEIGYYSNIGSYGLNGYMDEIPFLTQQDTQERSPHLPQHLPQIQTPNC